MKRTTLVWLVLVTAVMCNLTPPVSAQETKPQVFFRSFPLHGGNPADARPDAARNNSAAAALPLWSFTTVASRNGKVYSGSMVGRSPFFHGARTTNIATVLVPLKITIKNGGGLTNVFDPTQPDAACLPNGTDTAATLVAQSPLMNPASFTMNGVDEGSTQYVDAFQRANFFTAINETGDSYHTLLNLTKTVPAVALTINAPAGAIAVGQCTNLGVININVLDKMLISQVLPSLAAQGVGPDILPVFLFYNVGMSDGNPSQKNPGGKCCILGYHSGTGSLPNPQLYAVADFDSTQSFTDDGSDLDTLTLSHEIAELIDDPIGNNATPAWGHTGQVSRCQKNLEVGDPLNNSYFPSVTMPNGVTYHLQELAFYSWFFGAPSIGAGDLFSNNGSFTAAARHCP